VRDTSRGPAKHLPQRVLNRSPPKRRDTIQTRRQSQPARTDLDPPASLPSPLRRTQLTVGCAHLTSTRSSIATAQATPPRNSQPSSESTRPRCSRTSTDEASNDARTRSSGTTRHLPPPLADTRTAPHSPTSPHNSDSTRQPSPTASAEQASRSDPDTCGADRATTATRGRISRLSTTCPRVVRVSPTGITSGTRDRRF